MSNSGSELSIDTDVAKPIVTACDVLIDEYRRLIVRARHLKGLGGFGTLDSGRALQGKFEGKAFGSPDSLVNALESHITVVDGMRAYFQKCIDNAAAQEQQNVDSLRGVGRIN